MAESTQWMDWLQGDLVYSQVSPQTEVEVYTFAILKASMFLDTFCYLVTGDISR